MPTFQHRMVRAFVELAETLVGELDVADMLFQAVERLTDSFGASAVALLLIDQDGRLQPMAWSGEQGRMMALLEAQTQTGPAHDAFESRAYSVAGDFEVVRSRWPEVAEEAIRCGYTAAHAVPMGLLHGEMIGAIVLFDQETEITEDQASAIQGIADIATIAVLQGQALSEAHATADQLRVALRTRVVLEQAKGMIAQAHGLSPDKAFALMRAHARSRRIRLSEVARGLVNGETDASAIDKTADLRTPRPR